MMRWVQTRRRGRRPIDSFSEAAIGEAALNEIRAATNKGWVLGTDRFRKAVEDRLNRPAAPRPRGGDRRSERYRKSRRSAR